MGHPIARKNGKWMVVCLFPDVCKTPVGPATPPIPYPVVAHFSNTKKAIVPVRVNGDHVVVFDKSYISFTLGDQPGILKGIKSNTVGGKCHPKDKSKNVRAKKKFVVRLGDKFWMNGK
ncbi:Uncharacterised protein [Pragia fontium]|uniref:DUF4150 domain-containing protein n=1 Tax=Pragia fontium TaxID=82985 RepID=UPI000E0312E6|nr:DUF4150 domain-containing protein [Pragia fontium]SUB81857.1 Uncharacterised protein [Pragia fontium]